MELLQLKQKRAALIPEMKEAAKKAADARTKGEESRAAEYDAEFDRAEKEERELTSQIQRLERIEESERRAAADHLNKLDERGQKPEGPAKTADYESAFRTWFTRGMEALSPEERSLLSEKRGTADQVTTSNGLGGFTIPTGFLPELERAMKDYSGIMQVARLLRTASGNVLYIPTEDDTSTVANKIGEGSAITVQDLTFAQRQLDAYKYSTQMRISWELMQDSAFNLEAEVRNVFGARFGRAMNETCTIGDGTGDPNGVVTASTLGKQTASATAITFNEMIDLLHSVDPAYRISPSSGFMMHDAILAVLKKITLGSGDISPLWLPSVRQGDPDTILGKPYWINQAMDSTVAATKKPVLFGDFSKYVIRLVQDVTVIRLNERYADNGLVGFVGWARWDGECVNTAAIKHLLN